MVVLGNDRYYQLKCGRLLMCPITILKSRKQNWKMEWEAQDQSQMVNWLKMESLPEQQALF